MLPSCAGFALFSLLFLCHALRSPSARNFYLFFGTSAPLIPMISPGPRDGKTRSGTQFPGLYLRTVCMCVCVCVCVSIFDRFAFSWLNETGSTFRLRRTESPDKLQCQGSWLRTRPCRDTLHSLSHAETVTCSAPPSPRRDAKGIRNKVWG